MLDISSVRVVLVCPQHPGNIGAVARAMKTMGLRQLVLVNPKSFPDAKATERASKADDILVNAQIASTLEQAIAPCELVIGTSARDRKRPWPVLDPRQCAEAIIEIMPNTPVAMVFGRESSGLDNHELQLCHYHVHIPSDEAYYSLNLAAAVQVLCYEVRMAQIAQAEAAGTAKQKPTLKYASSQELTQFDQHLQATLQDIDFIRPHSPKQLMTRLRRLFMRARLEKLEVRLLRGILSRIQQLRP